MADPPEARRTRLINALFSRSLSSEDSSSGGIDFAASTSSVISTTGIDLGVFEFDPETVHYRSFRKEIRVGFVPFVNDEEMNSIDWFWILEHPNRYFTRELATRFYIFPLNFPNVKAKVLDSDTRKLWIFGRDPRNAVLINKNEVFYVGGDMYLGPRAGGERTLNWLPLVNLNGIASQIIGFVSAEDYNTVAYTDSEVYFWARINGMEIDRHAVRTGLPFCDGAVEDLSLKNSGDKYIKAVCGRNQTLLLTQNGDLYGYIKNFTDPDPDSFHLGLLLGSAGTSKYPKFRTFKNDELNMSNHRVIDVACTPNACYIIIGTMEPTEPEDPKESEKPTEPGTSKASKEPPMESKNKRLGSIFGWGQTVTDLCPADDMPTQLRFGANMNEDFVKIAAASTYVLALNADQQLHFLCAETAPNHEKGQSSETLHEEGQRSETLHEEGQSSETLHEEGQSSETLHEEGQSSETLVKVPNGINVLNIAAVYNSEIAAVLLDTSQIYVTDIVIVKGRRVCKLKPTSCYSMMEVFMRHSHFRPSRPYQTITFSDKGNTGVPGSSETPSDQTLQDSGDSLKRTPKNPEGSTTVKRQKSNEETSELKKSSTF